jgi:hypothetical protein
VAQVSASAESNAPHIILKRPAVADVDGVPILVVASDYRDGRGELVQAAHIVPLSASTAAMRSPIHSMQFTAMLFPSALYLGPSGQSPAAFLRQEISV